MRWLRSFACIAVLALLGSCGPPLHERSFTIEATEMRFIPDTVEAVVGEQVFVTLHNTGKLSHSLTFRLPAGDRTISADSGIEAVLAFPANTAGSFRFFCSLPGHEGMQGILEIRKP
ncbi:MAG: cupredoxin domain-containing protein [Chloroflexales bacterium]